MNLKVTNISALQVFQLIRYSAFMLIGVIFTKTQLSTSSIGEYEQFLFLASGVSFFWLNGLIRGILPLSKEKDGTNRFFSAFVLLSFFTVLCIILVSVLSKPLSKALLSTNHIPELGLLSLYLFLSVPASLIEYFFLIRDEPKKIVWYGVLSFLVMILLVVFPPLFGMDILFSLYGLLLTALLRYLYLWYLMIKNTRLVVSVKFIKEHLSLSSPLILSALLGGSAQYVDGFIVTSKFDEATFAVFRYGARELPLVVLIANAFSNAMLPEFGSKGNMEVSLQRIRNESAKLTNLLFPFSVVLLVLSHALFPIIFNARFEQSATIFNIYLLLIISRLVFPQTILIGLKQTSFIAKASFTELAVNVGLSLWFVNLWGLAGIAYATVLAYIFEKLYLVFVVKSQLNIRVTKYQNISLHLFYSILLLLVFYIVEFIVY